MLRYLGTQPSACVEALNLNKQSGTTMRALTIAVGLTGLVTSAVAADLPVRPAPPPAPIFSWTGFYFGPHIGGGWANGDAQTVSGPEPGFFDPFRSNLNGTGVVAGG